MGRVGRAGGLVVRRAGGRAAGAARVVSPRPEEDTAATAWHRHTGLYFMSVVHYRRALT